MSLEDAIRENTEAIKAQTAFLQGLQGKGGAAAGTPAAGKPATDKVQDTPKPKTKPKAETSSITEAEVQERVGKYLKSGTAEEREAAKGHVRQIIEHYGAPKFTAIKPAQWAAALADLDAFAEGGTPDWAASTEDEPGSEDDNMI